MNKFNKNIKFNDIYCGDNIYKLPLFDLRNMIAETHNAMMANIMSPMQFRMKPVYKKHSIYNYDLYTLNIKLLSDMTFHMMEVCKMRDIRYMPLYALYTLSNFNRGYDRLYASPIIIQESRRSRRIIRTRK